MYMLYIMAKQNRINKYIEWLLEFKIIYTITSAYNNNQKTNSYQTVFALKLSKCIGLQTVDSIVIVIIQSNVCDPVTST